MSEVIGTLESAIGAQVVTQLPDALLLTAVAEAELAQVRTRKTIVDVVWDTTTYSRSEEIGPEVHQQEHWRWLVYVNVPIAADGVSGREVAYEALVAIRAGLVPAAGFKPDTYCSPMELESAEFVGTGVSFRVYLLTLVHDRWEG